MSTPDPLSKDDNHSGTWHGVHPSSIRAPQQIAKPNKTLYLFTSLGCEALLSQDAVAAARACTIHPTNFSSDVNVVKINLYNIPACEATNLRKPLKAAMTLYGKVIYIHAYTDHHGQFCDEAAADRSILPWTFVPRSCPPSAATVAWKATESRPAPFALPIVVAVAKLAAAKAHAAAKKDDANEGQEANLSAEDNTTLPQPPATPVTGANIKDDAMIPDVETPDASAANSTTALTATTIKDSWIKTKIVSGDIDVIMGDPTGTSTNSTQQHIISMNEGSIHIGTLNIRGLVSTLSTPSSPKSLLCCYLRSLCPPLSLLALQETHTFPEHKQSLNILFQTQSSLWTKHCGLVSFNLLLLLTLLSVLNDERVLSVLVSHSYNCIDPFILVIMYDAITAPNALLLPTFYNGHQYTYIDFIFRSPALTTTSPEIIFLNLTWTDHSLLTISLTLQRPSGRGAVDYLDATESAASQWDMLKQVIKNFMMAYAKQFVCWCKTVEHSLCSEWQRLLCNPLLPGLTKTEARITQLQESKTANLAQRASVR
ncbi:hypothetical protein PHYBLDRAFT_144985 [Phycomyces blakesleeanus NRRL 1555(-)]|uniref:Endonuclease/exonuclease/phosphatase domain-containing protein n=1 Tax=Phycomyces blakesleeanus (strain ATCC 8743b / DSM 1359 / FGSC 10004 / NBRC 33097 / NRRL 1555) TaxID=763407 RepID=A0A163E0E6_PHYB8|nr:hypothetical protein PHYBLDRAFT_144985 [Phycomyces blakesleeanus NRRL 1555(-)]OAD74550.1 hypothetical protein PHYBLDRAFT_144985 [Phycomyces blakesleeanus NRRL 1555(-)]|eukprot:XP_018292590.1 hypothetical protein PHYBLDRAFT_144985 [Phycomyces blakesleeanus NRRL 1555(-)]